jgi:uncharacterized alkaline shock family protein YloU
LNIFNRIIVILLLFFIIISSVVIIVNIFTDLFRWSDIFDRILTFKNSINLYLFSFVFLIIIIISIVLLFFEFYRRKIRITNIASVKQGKASITLKSVSAQVQEKLSEIKDISNLKVKSLPKSDGTIINIYTRLKKGINVSKKMQEIIDEVNKFATENLGLKVLKTNITVIDFTQKPEKSKNVEMEEEVETPMPEEPKEFKTTDEDYD